MKVIKDTKNGLLKRREVIFKFESKSNPGLAQAATITAKEFSSDESVIAVKSVKGSFGSAEFTVESFIYDSAGDKNRLEPKPKEKKKEAAA